MQRKGLSAVAAIGLSLVMVLYGCGGGGGGSTPAGGTGELSLYLTDATTLAYRAVYVTIDRVDVHLGGDENSPDNWKTVADPKATYNLLELVNGVLEHLGLSELDAGHYTQMRLIIGITKDDGENILGDAHPHANYLILDDPLAPPQDNIKELKVPSGFQTGIKLVKEFLIEEGEVTELILDFDAHRSVVKAGASGLWLLKPTIRVIDTRVLTSIRGKVVDEEGDPVEGALISAQIAYPGAIDPKDRVIIEAASLTNESGEFIMLVEPGTYNVVAYKDEFDFAVVCDVAVPAEQTVNLEDDIELSRLGETSYGFIGGTVDEGNEGSVTISFRVSEAACADNIEVKSIRLDHGAQYSAALPVGSYKVVAWNDDGQTVEIEEPIEVEGGEQTELDIVIGAVDQEE